MTARTRIAEHLRDRILGGLHVGLLRGGDRLPGIRDVAKELRRNPRTVKAAYEQLAHEGLVEIRARSGVFVAEQDVPGADASEESVRWLSEVVAEGWLRRFTTRALPRLLERATASVQIRCALVEGIEDAIVALKHELQTEWGFRVDVVAPDALHLAGDVDFFAATSFHAASIHAAIASMGRTLVVLTAHPGLNAALASRIREGRLTVIAVDARFADRLRVIYAADSPERVVFVSADDTPAIAALDPREPVLLTRAASRRLPAIDLPPLVFPHSPTISPAAARALASILVRRNAAAGEL